MCLSALSGSDYMLTSYLRVTDSPHACQKSNGGFQSLWASCSSLSMLCWSLGLVLTCAQAAEPRLVAVQEENARDIATDLGELAAIVQHVYSLAASRLQPFIRGALARRRLPDALWEMFSYVRWFHCRTVRSRQTV